MTTINKEQAVQLALQAGFMKFLKPESRPEMICGPDEIARLIKLARNQALEEARLACCEERPWVGRAVSASECLEIIESLKDNTPPLTAKELITMNQQFVHASTQARALKDQQP